MTESHEHQQAPPEGAAASTPPPTPITLTLTEESGLGRLSALPTELRGWSWGAFFFTWIWGLFNGAYITLWGLLIGLIPGGGLIWAIVCGLKGREWAWKGKRWESPEAFRKTQKGWAIAGVVCCLLAIVLFIAIFPTITTSAKIITS